MESELLTVAQVLERLQISRPTLRRWCDLGLFPRPLAAGPRLLRWVQADIDAWIAREPQHRQAIERCDAARAERDRLQSQGIAAVVTVGHWAADEVPVSRVSEIETSENKMEKT
jgi:predicted DNA-binding transcriptional regulator AlpA